MLSVRCLSVCLSVTFVHCDQRVGRINPSYKKDKELSEKIQHRFTKMVINMRENTYEERLKQGFR